MDNRKTTTNAVQYLTLKMAGAVFALLNTVILARMLGAQQYGVMVLVLALANICGTVAALGMQFFVTREIAVFRDARKLWELRRVVNISQILALVTAALIVSAGFLAYRMTNRFFGIRVLQSAPTPLLIMGAMAVPLLALNLVRAGILRGMNRVIAADMPEIAFRPVAILLCIALTVLATLTLSPARAFAIILLSILGAFLFGRILLRQTLRSIDRDKTLVPQDRKAASSVKMLRQAPHFLVVTLLAMMDGQISIYLIAGLLGARDVGLYQVALQPTTVILMGLTAASISVQPTVATAWARHNVKVAQNAIQRAVRFSAAIAIACGAILYMFSGFVVHLYGEQFVAASILLRVLLVGQVITGITGPQGAVLMMTGNQKTLFYCDLAFLTLKVAIIASAIHYLGLLGAAVGELLYIAAMRLSGVFITYRRTGLMTMIWRTRREY